MSSHPPMRRTARCARFSALAREVPDAGPGGSPASLRGPSSRRGRCRAPSRRSPTALRAARRWAPFSERRRFVTRPAGRDTPPRGTTCRRPRPPRRARMRSTGRPTHHDLRGRSVRGTPRTGKGDLRRAAARRGTKPTEPGPKPRWAEGSLPVSSRTLVGRGSGPVFQPASQGRARTWSACACAQGATIRLCAQYPRRTPAAAGRSCRLHQHPPTGHGTCIEPETRGEDEDHRRKRRTPAAHDLQPVGEEEVVDGGADHGQEGA